jgi:hypothetical protein
VNGARERGRTIPCIGCGAPVPDVDGPTHDYLDASPGCWGLFGQMLAQVYGDRRSPLVHSLCVDAYAVQHPGIPQRSAHDRRAIQSVAVHLIRLCLVLERGFPADVATDGMRRALLHKERFRWLAPPASLGEWTIVDVSQAGGAAEHEALVRRWARSAWAAWSPHHDTIRGWAEGYDG